MKSRTLLLLIAALAITRPALAQAPLSSEERRAVAAVDRGVADALALLERAVNINSGTMNFPGVRATGDLFDAEFRRLGFTTRWVDGSPWGRAGHFIAEWRGNGRGPKIMFIGHLDTVFEQDSPFQRWVRMDDSTAAGPGSTDMKGGDVIMLLALRAMKDAGILDRVQVTVYLGGDEENAGTLPLARRDIMQVAEWADLAIGFEDAAGDPRTAVIGRRSSGNWLLRTAGHPSHSSQIFRENVGSGAIFEASRILAAFHDSLAGEANLTFNPGTILGGSAITFDMDQNRGTAFGKTNVVAESAAVAGDLRALTPEQIAHTQDVMRRIVARHYPGTDASIAFENRYPPLAPTDGNRRLLALLDDASRAVGTGPVTPVEPARAGAADISFVAGLVNMAIDGMGLMGSGGHTVLERANLRTLPMQAKRVAVLLNRLATRPTP
jgi:glutamate carboxypeptidase